MVERTRQREQFLLQLYDLVDGRTSERVLINQVGEALGFDDTTSDRVSDWLCPVRASDCIPAVGGRFEIPGEAPTARRLRSLDVR